MLSRIRRVFFRNYVFSVDESVYEPAEDSFLFAENLDVKEGERVLDMGTGCGILGIVAAEKANEVVAVDVNPYAVRCAKENSILNNTRNKMVFVGADLFGPFHNRAKFDVVMFNAPYLPVENGENDSFLSRAWKGGETGRTVIDRFIPESPNHMRPEGRLLLMQSTLAGVEETLMAFEEHGMVGTIVAECRVPLFETITLLRATHRSS